MADGAAAAEAAPGARKDVRAAMKQLLQAKAAKGAIARKGYPEPGVGPAAAPAAAASKVPAAASCEEVEEEDPWPELPLSATRIGVQDGLNRARTLEARLDYGSAARMYAKALYVARKCAASLPEGRLEELAVGQAVALLRSDDWKPLAAVCDRALASSPDSPEVARRLLLCRARARAELGEEQAARRDLDQARARVAPGSAEEVAEEAREVEARLAELARSRPSKAPAAQASPLDGLDGLEESLTPRSKKSDAASLNQEFFTALEREYEAHCAADGWDDVRKSMGETTLMKASAGNAQSIPASSDYFRIVVPGKDRELRLPAEAARAAAPEESRVARCRRNLDELRRVEEETRRAIEAEKARRAAAAAGSSAGGSESEAPEDQTQGKGGLDSIFDSEDEAEDEKPILRDELSAEEEEKAQKLYLAMQEFERLGREKEERLAKWRDRWG